MRDWTLSGSLQSPGLALSSIPSQYHTMYTLTTTSLSMITHIMQGVAITAEETYTSSRPEGAKLHPSSEEALSLYTPLLLRQTKDSIDPCEWRTEAGNQIVGT